MNHILIKTFENEFKEDNFKDLVVNLFNRFDFSKEQSLKHYFTDDEKQKIKDFTYLGTYEDAESKSLDVLIVELKGGSKVERARSLQRNLIGKYLKGNRKDAALVAFYSKDNPDWRLSFVRMDYKLDAKGAKVVIGTPPKRYSFLVGKTEPSHTAKKQLQPIISPDVTPTVLDVEKAFSIEKVTKEFYNRIAEMFTHLVGGERKIGSRIISEAGYLRLPSTSNDTIKKEFAVRLIGRLLFCWFLKKKKSEAGNPLLTSVLISSDAVRQESDYYHRYLEPLFFQVLNTPWDKRLQHFRHDFWRGIPFLNGGLFEPHVHDYCQIDGKGELKPLYSLKIPDEWFLNLFKIFEEYNFTIDESSTIDIEISVDPEMLGRIFENLLAEINPETGETARKSTGSYYTPRPIVEYMVDESLKQYLVTQTGIDEGKIAGLLSYAEDATGLTEAETDSIINALDRVKIIDPACGSGAFPMGILHKMLLILQKIDPESKKWVDKKLLRIDNKLLRQEMGAELRRKNWDYIHKLGIIQNSIYGVDIQTIAVEISKLRFFLSLIVDEKIDDAKLNRGVVPLPNLEFKFVAANSLIGLPEIKKETTIDFLSEADHKVAELKRLRDEYFTSSGVGKGRIEREFLALQGRLLDDVMRWQKITRKSAESQALKVSQWNPFEDEASSWFDPEWMFGVKDGFDIVIANPPYISHDKIANKETIKTFKSYEPFADVYCYFLERCIYMQSEKGLLCFITSNSYLKAEYGLPLRKLLNKENRIVQLINIEDMQLFQSAIVNTAIIIAQKKFDNKNSQALIVNAGAKEITDFPSYINNNKFYYDQEEFQAKSWCLLPVNILAVRRKIQQSGKTLEEYHTKIRLGIATGANEAFIIDNRQRTIFKNLNGKNLRIIEPLLRGKDIYRYGYKLPDLYILLTKNEIDVKKEYPDIYNYLNSFGDKFKKRGAKGKHWTNLRACAFFDDFKKEKIVWIELADKGRFALCNEEIYLLNSAYFLIPPKDLSSRYLLGILNSTVIQFYLHSIAETSGMGVTRWINTFVKEFPIPNITIGQQKPIEKKVSEILSLTNNGDYLDKPDKQAQVSALERQINELVYALYGLAPEEIEIVEGKR